MDFLPRLHCVRAILVKSETRQNLKIRFSRTIEPKWIVEDEEENWKRFHTKQLDRR